MITFDNLAFSTLSNMCPEAIQALVLFDNGYGVSVITGPASCGLYGSREEGTYEIAAIRGNGTNWDLVYPEGTSFECNVLGYRTPEEITELMIELQRLPKQNTKFTIV